MSLRVIGPNPTLTSWRLEKDPTTGFKSVYTWEGSRAAIFGLATLVTSDQKYVIDDTDKPIYRLIISSPDSGAPDVENDYVLEWELLGNDVEKSIYEHPNARVLGDKMLTAIKIAIKEVEDAALLNSSTVYAENETNLAAIAVLLGVSSANALLLFRLIVKGTTSFVASQYVLRRTQTISSRGQVTFSFSNVDKIHTAAQVLASELVPAEVQFSIAAIPEPTAQTGYSWGWLKKTPTIAQAAGRRFQCVQEYWLEQWSTFLYDAAS
jgi:hypothetical protein